MNAKLAHFAALSAAAVGLLQPSQGPSAPAQAPASQQYALLFMEPSEGFRARTGQEAKAYWERWTAYIGSLQQSGKMSGGGAIQGPESGRLFGSEKEVAGQRLRVSGYVILEASSLAEASSYAAKSPAAADGGAVDVRPLLPMAAKEVK